MHILLTRPLDDSKDLILRFTSLGHKVSHLPLLNIEKTQHEKVQFSDYGGIIFTSANAVKFLDQDIQDKYINCFCVGNATEKKARSLGFQNTIAAEGNVSNLIELILQNHDIKNKNLLYISGELISIDLEQKLSKEGFIVKRVINYRVTHNQNFNENFVSKLRLDMPDMVYIYSYNSALSFLNFIKNYQLERLCMNTNLLCIGEKTSSILNEIKWKKIFLFSPGEEEFLLYKI